MDEIEAASAQAKKLAEQALLELRTHLNVCGLSGTQVDRAFQLIYQFATANSSVSTMIQQDQAERRAEYRQAMASLEAERQAAISQDNAEREAEIAEQEAEDNAQHENLVRYVAILEDRITWDHVVMARSRSEAIAKVHAAYTALSPADWRAAIGCVGDEPEIVCCDQEDEHE